MPKESITSPRTARRRFWLDPRFIIGVVLVLVSVTGVWLVVDANDSTVPVYAAPSTLPAGVHISADELAVTRVSLGGVDGEYVREGELPAGDLVVTRTVGDGELIPASAVAAASESAVTAVVVEIPGELPASVDIGTRVDVWAAAPNDDDTGFGQPTVIVDSAVVAHISDNDAMVGQASTSVEILVPKGDVATVLSALANGHALSLVPESSVS
ncbi:hypothetical protein [Microbacterium sp. MPKO10]|uniref:hypothetical protein n=1 Tax=Microbacterium sp. MPKO10 TaxID=2989818 RepID=UPI00223627CB|nr:hypothetical protein [Microbacterium sp. MPKO10]MCW4458441.1 hypothetical protein [Microbacterium sp. MPKO10]